MPLLWVLFPSECAWLFSTIEPPGTVIFFFLYKTTLGSDSHHTFLPRILNDKLLTLLVLRAISWTTKSNTFGSLHDWLESLSTYCHLSFRHGDVCQSWIPVTLSLDRTSLPQLHFPWPYTHFSRQMSGLYGRILVPTPTQSSSQGHEELLKLGV